MPEIKSNIKWPWTGDPRQGPEYFFSMNPFSYPAPTKFDLFNVFTPFLPPLDNNFDGTGWGELTPQPDASGFSLNLGVQQDGELLPMLEIEVSQILPSFGDEGIYENSTVRIVSDPPDAEQMPSKGLWVEKTSGYGWILRYDYLVKTSLGFGDTFEFSGKGHPVPFYKEWIAT